MADVTPGRQPRPGWYHDPAGGGYRWWAGSAWTTQVVGAAATMTVSRPPSSSDPAPPGSAPDGAGVDRGRVEPVAARTQAVRTVRTASPGDRARVEGQPGWVPAVIAGLVVCGAVLVVIGSVLPWVRASAAGAVPVTRLGTDTRAGWATIGASLVVALEAGRWLQRRRASRRGAVVALLAGVGAAGAAAVGFGRLAGGVATLAGATGPVTRTAGVGVPMIAAGCVAVFSGAVAGVLS